MEIILYILQLNQAALIRQARQKSAWNLSQYSNCLKLNDLSMQNL